MRALVPAALSAALLVAALPFTETGDAEVGAAALLAKVRSCQQISRGLYRADAGAPADIPVCGVKGAVFFTADLDVDCDGRPSRECGERTDPLFQPTTAFQQSDGRQLDAARLPYVVVPGASEIWDHAESGIRGGAVAAVIHEDKVLYAVVGDTGPTDLVGEASYAAAEALGIDPDPVRGGTGSEVTYILFENSRATPIESHEAAVAEGTALARRLLRST
ncbi:glycoside hydrolase family 75 protein [Streptomyces sp. E11-3]|uniref:glycoside hydrolase family 75 protein n=1 Tax=Streptomyces sp. E11-3 TaxID=3110112 RepID=UPI00397F47E3